MQNNISSKFGLYMLLGIIAIGFITGLYFIIFGEKNLQNVAIPGIMPSLAPTKLQENQNQLTPSIPADETENWKTYKDQEWNVEFKYPLEYEVVKNKYNISVINKTDSRELLSISKNLTDYQSMRRCEAEKDRQQPLPCLWTSMNNKAVNNTDKEIEELLFNGVQVKSFYIQESIVRSNIHVLQTISNPLLELRLDRNLNLDQILSTFKFLE